MSLRLRATILMGTFVSIVVVPMSTAVAGVAFFQRMAGPNGATIDWDFTAAGASLPSMLTLTRGSTATYVNSSGYIASAATNTARIDFDPGTLAQKGLLLEPSVTNQVKQSHNLANASWQVKTNVTTTANAATGPDNTASATSVKETTANGYHSVYQDAITSTANTTVTISIFAKAAGTTRLSLQVQDATAYSDGFEAHFNLSTASFVSSGQWGTGLYSSSTVTAYPNGWYRLTMTGRISSSNANCMFQVLLENSSGVQTYIGNASNGIYFWGAQVEAGSQASSIIPTTTAAVTRSADQVTFGSMGWLNASAGTMVAQYVNIGSYSGSTYRVFSLSNTNVAGTFNQNEIFMGDDGVTYRHHVVVGAAFQLIYSGAENGPGSINKIAISYGTTFNAISVNGAAASTNVGSSLPTPAYAYIGSQPDGLIRPRWIQKIKYLPYTVSGANLQTLSTP